MHEVECVSCRVCGEGRTDAALDKFDKRLPICKIHPGRKCSHCNSVARCWQALSVAELQKVARVAVY